MISSSPLMRSYFTQPQHFQANPWLNLRNCLDGWPCLSLISRGRDTTYIVKWTNEIAGWLPLSITIAGSKFQTKSWKLTFPRRWDWLWVRVWGNQDSLGKSCCFPQHEARHLQEVLLKWSCFRAGVKSLTEFQMPPAKRKCSTWW